MAKGRYKQAGGGSGGGRMTGRRMTNIVKDGDMRDLEQEEPGGTQATAMMAAHGGADGGRGLWWRKR